LSVEPGEDYSGIVDLYANECVGELGRRPPRSIEWTYLGPYPREAYSFKGLLIKGSMVYGE
jgi:hypothetical protein